MFRRDFYRDSEIFTEHRARARAHNFHEIYTAAFVEYIESPCNRISEWSYCGFPNWPARRALYVHRAAAPAA